MLTRRKVWSVADALLLEDKLPVLARELAMGIYEVEDILTRYGISWDEFERIQGMGRFQKLLETTTVEWGSTLNTRERIKVKALAGVEDGLAGLFMSAKDTRETLASRVEAYKLARVLAGIGEKDPNEIAPEKFTLTINVGDTSTVVGGGPPVIEGSAYDRREHRAELGPQNLRESSAHDDAREKDTDQLFEFTSGVSNESQDLRSASLNTELTAGYDEGRHDSKEK